MQDKTLHFLSLLNPSDLKRFDLYLQSPLFNRREKVYKLFLLMLEHVKPEPGLEFTEEAAFVGIYPGETFVVNKIRKLKGALLELLFDFLEFQEWEESRMGGIGRAKALNRVNENQYFMSFYNKGKKKLAAIPFSFERAEGAFNLELERFHFENRSTGRGKESHYPKVMQALQNLELNRILKYVYVSLLRQKVIGEVSCPDIFLQVLKQMSSEKTHDPLIRMYHLLCMTLMYPERKEDLWKLRTLIQEEGEQVESSEIRDIYLGAINNFNRNSGLKREELFEELWSLNRDMYELLVKKRGFSLSFGQYKNMVMFACRLQKFTWLDTFIEEAAGHLQGKPKEVEGARIYNEGVKGFYQKNWDLAERSFNRSFKKIPDIFYQLDTRVYLLMIHFETQNSVGMESLTHSFRMFLDREDRVASFHRKNYGDFIRFYKRLVEMPPGAKEKIQKLRQEIAQSGLQTGQSWLREKLELL